MKFATAGDKEKYLHDLCCYGTAVLDAQNKHVPLNQIKLDSLTGKRPWKAEHSEGIEG